MKKEFRRQDEKEEEEEKTKISLDSVTDVIPLIVRHRQRRPPRGTSSVRNKKPTDRNEPDRPDETDHGRRTGCRRGERRGGSRVRDCGPGRGRGTAQRREQARDDGHFSFVSLFREGFSSLFARGKRSEAGGSKSKARKKRVKRILCYFFFLPFGDEDSWPLFFH